MDNAERAQRTLAADRVAIELKHRGFDDETVNVVRDAVANGDDEALAQIWLRRDLATLPRSTDLRPIYSAGRFPQDPGQVGPGGAVLTAAEFADRVVERAEIVERYGDHALVATRFERQKDSDGGIL